MKPVNAVENLGQFFSQIADLYADKTALHFLSGQDISYGELSELSNRIARYLISMGIRSGDVIAIFNEKVKESYASMLACLKIGAIYTNLDPSSPVARLQKIFSICRPVLVLTGGQSLNLLSNGPFGHVPILDYTSHQFVEDVSRQEVLFSGVNIDVSGERPAYLMFTSGSTGFPKGAVMTHKNTLNFIRWASGMFVRSRQERFTNLNPMYFDNSVFDFYGALFSGASMVPVPEGLLKIPRDLLDGINQSGATIWFSVPSLWVYILRMRSLQEGDLPNLETIIFGGEGFPKNQLRKLYYLLGGRTRFVNVYGPTECTCICSSYNVSAQDLKDDDLLPLGSVTPDFGYAIVGDDLQPVPAGEVGELYLSGPNVGAGYYGDVEKTEEMFVQNPTHQKYKDIVYRTGDMVRYDAERNVLRFLGRKDNQIKRMGYRIELEEIEAGIGSLPYVEDNVVVFQKGSGEETGRIIAYVSAKQTDTLGLICDLRKILPSYMIPNQIIFKGNLPRNANGKLDRRQLQDLEVGL